MDLSRNPAELSMALWVLSKIFAQNIDCGYTLLTGTYNLCFGAKIRKIGIPCIPQFCYIKVGYKWVYITRKFYPDIPNFGKGTLLRRTLSTKQTILFMTIQGISVVIYLYSLV